MFKHAALAAVAATAFFAVPASAATVVYETGTTVPLTYNAQTNDWDGVFRFRVTNTTPGDPNGNFTANYTFQAPVNGQASTTAQSVMVTGNFGSDIDFTAATLNSSAGGVFNMGNGSFAFVFDAPVTTGTNTISFSGVLNPNGNRTGNGLVNGQLSLAVVPEPATWALFILGFGAIGSTMRRRSSQVRVAKASLNFA